MDAEQSSREHGPLSAAELKELRELEAKATPGEWGGQSYSVHSESGEGPKVCGVCGPNHDNDAALIAAMRNALPRLLSMLQQPAEHSLFMNSECDHIPGTTKMVPPADAAVLEAVEFFGDGKMSCPIGLYKHCRVQKHVDTLLSYVRAVQSPRLTEEQVEAVRMAHQGLRTGTCGCRDEVGYRCPWCVAEDKLEAAFSGEFGKEG